MIALTRFGPAGSFEQKAMAIKPLIFHARNLQALLFEEILIFVEKLIPSLVAKEKSSSFLTFHITRLFHNVHFFTIAETFKREDYR